MYDIAVQPGYQAVVNSTLDGIVVINQQGVVQSFNPAAERMFGYSSDEVIGQNVRMLLPQPHYDRHNEYLADYSRTGVGKIIGIGREVEGRRKDGSLIPVDLAITEWASNGIGYFTGTMRDLTERKIAELETRRALAECHELERVNRILGELVAKEVATREAAQKGTAQAERLQALGHLAGGIAHDFNNLLQAMAGAADLMRSQSGKPGTIINMAQTIESAVERGSSITERLLSFARRGNLRAEALDGAAILDNLSRLLAQTLGGSITVRVEVETALPHLVADKGTLETALINLATNARDAMPQGGVLTLSATMRIITASNNELNGLAPGSYINIATSDTGTGMDAATLTRAAEPFFTTKPQGKGTGLGLSMAKGFAEQSGGGLFIASTPGKGTVVSLVLPTEYSAIEERRRPADDPEQHCILLVDDDVLVRGTLQSQLELAGYKVTAAASGIEAIEAFETGGIDLLMTDLAMPGIDGLTLISRLQEQARGLPAILITGYAADDAIIKESRSYQLLLKPFTAAKMQAEIAACLASGARGQPPQPAAHHHT